jgi:bacterioferritin
MEEMQHADKLTVRIIFLDGMPNMQVLDPLRIGQTVKEILDCDLQSEMSARALYEEAATYCHTIKDYVTRDLSERLMHDEENHIVFLETQLDLVAKVGLELYAQHYIGEPENHAGSGAEVGPRAHDMRTILNAQRGLHSQSGSRSVRSTARIPVLATQTLQVEGDYKCGSWESASRALH